MGSNKLVITQKDDIVYYGYFKDGTPVELYCEPKEQQSLLGNIYAARVERVTDGINAAFLEIADGEKCYYSLPKGRQPIKLSSGHEDRLYGGDVILVQIRKDAVKTKLPVADSNITLDGKYFVLTLADKRLALSRKITNSGERGRLTSIALEYKTKEFGIIIRTNAEGVPKEQLQRELTFLIAEYHELMRKAAIAMGKTLLYREPPHYITLGRDLPEKELDEILTDQPEIFQEMQRYYVTLTESKEAVENNEETIDNRDNIGYIDSKDNIDDIVAQYAGKNMNTAGNESAMHCNLILYEDEYPLCKLYRLEHYYEEASHKLVWLKSGASIVIEQTEAMVVIDVNTGSVTKKKKREEEFFFQINCEAAQEIARQLRLRNLSGIIVIDFINMKQDGQKEKLIKLLEEECRKDRIPCRVMDMTRLGLLEMTRNKVRRPLKEQMMLCNIYKVL